MVRVVGVVGEDNPWPGLSETLVAHLETLFPPRCLAPNENVAEHHRYAGKVELVQAMRQHLNDLEDDHLQSILQPTEEDE